MDSEGKLYIQSLVAPFLVASVIYRRNDLAQSGGSPPEQLIVHLFPNDEEIWSPGSRLCG